MKQITSSWKKTVLLKLHKDARASYFLEETSRFFSEARRRSYIFFDEIMTLGSLASVSQPILKSEGCFFLGALWLDGHPGFWSGVGPACHTISSDRKSSVFCSG